MYLEVVYKQCRPKKTHDKAFDPLRYATFGPIEARPLLIFDLLGVEMYQNIIKFWFEEIEKSQWWKKDDKFDDLIKSRFLDIHIKATKGELFTWRKTSLGVLAEIIILDQFSRNMFRDEPESFAYDSIALVLAQSAIAEGRDLELNVAQRSFLYMPFMHSESLLIHEEAVRLFTELGASSPLEYENKHKNIIHKFGRYPHRNKILGRVSTLEELKFLTLPGSSF